MEPYTDKKSIDFIFLALPRWDTPYSSTTYSLAKELAISNRVFYIDNPFTIKDFITLYHTKYVKSRKQALLLGKNIHRKIEGTPDNFVVVTPRMTLPINTLPPGKLYKYFSGINDKIVYAAIKKTIKEFNIKNYLFINSFNPFYGHSFPNDFNPRLKVYQAVDNISESRYVYKHGPRLEKKVIQLSDIILTTSKELYRLKSALSKDVFYLPNAASLDLFNTSVFQKLSKPKDILDEKRPVICYMGNLDSRLDYDLLKNIALHHTEKLLLLIGPISTLEYKKHNLDQLGNVKFTGTKPLSELPAYLQHVHCTIIPFKSNNLTKSIYPLKLNEYLAAGKPVITTAFSEEVSSFQEIVYIAKNCHNFINLIDTAIDEDNSCEIQKRVAWVTQNSWSMRVKQFWEIIAPYL